MSPYENFVMRSSYLYLLCALVIVLPRLDSLAMSETCEFEGTWRFDPDTTLQQTPWYRGGKWDVRSELESLTELFGEIRVSDDGAEMHFGGRDHTFSSSNVTRTDQWLEMSDQVSNLVVHRLGCDTFGIYRAMRVSHNSIVRFYFSRMETSNGGP